MFCIVKIKNLSYKDLKYVRFKLLPLLQSQTDLKVSVMIIMLYRVI